MRLGGEAQAYSFTAQLIFVIIAVGMVIVLGDATLATMIACGINIIWWTCFEWKAMSQFRPRPATRPTKLVIRHPRNCPSPKRFPKRFDRMEQKKHQ